MRKIILSVMMMILLMMTSTAGAVTIEEAVAPFDRSKKIIYPLVRMEDKVIEQKINDTIFAEIDRFITETYDTAKEIEAEVYDMRTSYEIGSNGSGNTVILSVVLTESRFYKMAAHPMTWKRALNFNLTSGELMGMDYLLEVGEGVSEEEFRGRLERKLREHSQREKLYLFEEALPLKELPKEFYWDSNLHIHFIFNHYEVAPYASGIIDVDIDA